MYTLNVLNDYKGKTIMKGNIILRKKNNGNNFIHSINRLTALNLKNIQLTIETINQLVRTFPFSNETPT